MGTFRLTNKVKATIIFAVITFLAITFGLDLDKQTETLIIALVPVLVAVIIPQQQGSRESSQDSDRVQYSVRVDLVLIRKLW